MWTKGPEKGERGLEEALERAARVLGQGRLPLPPPGRAPATQLPCSGVHPIHCTQKSLLPAGGAPEKRPLAAPSMRPPLQHARALAPTAAPFQASLWGARAVRDRPGATRLAPDRRPRAAPKRCGTVYLSATGPEEFS